MKAWNRKKKPKHTTKMKWKSFTEGDWSTDRYIICNYSLSRCTKRLSEHNELDYSEIKRDRFSMKNYNDIKMWKGF